MRTNLHLNLEKMKVIELYRGSMKDVDYIIKQNDNMEVTAFKVDKGTKAHFSDAIPLGLFGDIYDTEVQGQIS